MTDTTNGWHPIYGARATEKLSREKIARLLDPPVSAKTLERWEKRVNPIPKWRLRQLALIYRASLDELEDVA